ncbi:hypothetical protein Tco_0624158 [Tanacetum coccineum]|uniref:Copia protein n=1 Tax=Tanacetum coccineum TaxID=301880 RepID=A0ABQ4WD67_9ASTR
MGILTLKTNEEPKDREDQAFLEELERLKRQEKEVNDAAEAFRKEFAQCTKDLRLQAGAAKATNTKQLNTSGYRRGSIDKTLFIKKNKNDIMLVQMILWETLHPLTWITSPQKEDGIFISQDKSMIGSLNFLTASRRILNMQVCACSRVSSFDHKRGIRTRFRYAEQILTGNPQQEVVNFLARDLSHGSARNKQSCSLSLSRSMLQNPVFHSKTKHIEIRHHFIRDAYEKKLIQVLKIHTDDNVADLLTKAFDVSRFNFLIVNIGMINL